MKVSPTKIKILFAYLTVKLFPEDPQAIFQFPQLPPPGSNQRCFLKATFITPTSSFFSDSELALEKQTS